MAVNCRLPAVLLGLLRLTPVCTGRLRITLSLDLTALTGGTMSDDTAMARGTVLGIDIGGTKMAAALVSADGTILMGDRIRTPAGDANDVFGALGELITRVRGDATPLAVGIGSAGPLDQDLGLVSPVNITGWRNFPLVERVRALAGDVPVTLGVDGHCFALGEFWTGAGREADTLLGIVVSTGVGGGLVVGGKPMIGQSGNAAH